MATAKAYYKKGCELLGEIEDMYRDVGWNEMLGVVDNEELRQKIVNLVREIIQNFKKAITLGNIEATSDLQDLHNRLPVEITFSDGVLPEDVLKELYPEPVFSESFGEKKERHVLIEPKKSKGQRLLALMKLVLIVIFSVAIFVLMLRGCEKKPEREYYESGKLKSEIFYKYKKIYTGRSYLEGYNWRSEADYIPEKPDGVAKWYYESGHIKSEAVFKEGKFEGIKKDYYENGQLKTEGVYKNGNPVPGTVKWYDENGNLRYGYDKNGNLKS